MRLRRNNAHPVLVAGIFSKAEAGETALGNLRRAGFQRVAAIHASAEGRIHVKQHFLPAKRVEPTNLSRYSRTILPNEALVLAEVKTSEAARTVTILREAGTEEPVTFAFHASAPFSFEFGGQLLDRQRPSGQRLAENAASLARALLVSHETKPRGPSFLRRLREIERALEWANASLTMSADVHHAFTLSAEWLLDNAYLIREQMTDLRRSLPQRKYGELPLIATGPRAGLPRVDRLASEMVAESGGALEPETIRKFLVAFQTVTPLDIAELWALPLMLRLQSLESLRGVALQVEREQSLSEEADFWANRLITAARHSPPWLLKMMELLVARHPEPAPHFASELVAHLYDEEAALPMVTGWLERVFRVPLLEAMQQEHRRQTMQQTALANLINSCRRFAQITWRDFFETVSWAESKLAGDPAGIYSRSDFETRDRCRTAVEEIARRSKRSEREVIEQTLALARGGEDELTRHIGYYLIDAGRPALERAVGARVPLVERSRRWLRAHPARAYFGSIFLLTIAMVAVPFLFIFGSVPGLTFALLGLLLIIPASELAVLAINYFTTSFLPPQVLPKMSFEKRGIPDDCRTLVVVPILLSTPAAIRNELKRLEIRHLGNTDPNLCFALLSDFADAPRQSMPEDAEYLDIVARGVEELNRRYGNGRFLLFHRGRSWSESEERWIGWERKRGKLEQLNRFLSGENPPELEGFLRVGDRAQLEGIRFVITLDADTQLLRGAARRMIETLAHPLNEARLSPDGRRVIRGYTIIQPGVSATLPSATSTWFSRIFADPRGIDPYTRAVSDVYQDLVSEGSYHGKGIYELRTFHRLLSGRFPEGRLLSHDLLEGSYVRVGLATDIELLDVFPSSYTAWWSRQHRWVRGDWQIINWLKRRVPVAGGGMEPNPLSAFSRWKIFDNLRRSLVPPATVALLVAGWLFTGRPILWSLIIAGLMLWPVLSSGLALVLHPPPPGTRFWREPRDRFLRSVFTVLLLPDYAGMALDAIVRVAYRRLVSHRRLLEWEAAQDAHRRAKNRQRQFVLHRLWIPALSVFLLAGMTWKAPSDAAAAAPFLVLWMLFPVAVVLIDYPAKSWRGGILTADDHRFLRRMARRTWRYFDDFVGPHTSWLPPDNVQEVPTREIFLRTSPTNIGLWMLATVAANDFGYITIDDLVARNLGTLETINRLERFEGHLLNWYDLKTLQPLHPRYVSTVDSGNLLASLWTFQANCQELVARPVLDASSLRTITDILELLGEAGSGLKKARFPAAFSELEKLAGGRPTQLEEIIMRLRAAQQPARKLESFFCEADSDPRVYWARQLSRHVAASNSIIDRYLRPVEILMAPPQQLVSLGEAAHECRREVLGATFSLRNIAVEGISGLAPLLAYERGEGVQLPAAVREWLDILVAEVARSRLNASEQLARLDELLAHCRQLKQGMELRFLYDEERRIFAIGYQVAERRLDTSFYDLLASEARLASFLAIARGEVPVEHWWALSRPFGSAYRRLPLLSWNGTMFEYLMPLLFNQTNENSLLDRACHDAVRCQIAYAERNRVPWGISESAFSALDRNNVYQYRAFGVPALALRRGQEEDLVVAPYAAALALSVEPAAAARNLRRLATVGDAALLGDFGYYEAIDYSRRAEPRTAAGIVIRCYMAHHQGMALIAYDNALNGNIIRRRFHSDPRVRATEPLLHERVPEQILPTTGEVHEERPLARATPVLDTRVVTQQPDISSARIHLLSNGTCAAILTNSGGGYLRWADLNVTRWSVDATCDAPGAVCYIRDLESGTFWSGTHLPVRTPERRYTLSFTPDKAEFRRRSGPCETITEIAISAEDDAEVRRVTLVNTSRKACRLELTSYLELALAPHRVDGAHPAFNKLFIETEWLPGCQALVAHRRLRAPDEKPVWAAHLLVPESLSTADSLEFETDRAQFLGRGRTMENPVALKRSLTGSFGAVLDPIFSLRRQVELFPNQRFQFALVTAVAGSREAVIALVERYSEFHVCARSFETAWTHSQLEMRRLRIRPADVQTFRQLAAQIFFPKAQLRPRPARLSRRSEGQRALWRQGISGDLPIVLVMIANVRDIELVREVLTAHTFWHLRGLKTDLVIVSEEEASYEEPLTNQLRRLTEAEAYLTGVDQPGGVYLRAASKVAKEDLIAMQAAARMVLIAARGTLRQQLAATSAVVSSQPKLFLPRRQFREEPSAPLPFMELKYFNGLGGFTADGREYLIYLGPGRQTPLPWINVMANSKFGAFVSESGTESLWGANSQNERVTPWYNDPICDPAGTAIYIRDDDTGSVWSPTPQPVREKDAYRARHGQGYTSFEHNSHAIEQRLLTFVPVDDSGGLPLRVQRLHLRNSSSRRRKLTVTAYATLVLGSDPEKTGMHLATKWDLQSQSIFARNPYEPGLSERIAFASSTPPPISFTGDRAVFIGRNRSLRDPVALEHERLTGDVGFGLDPCVALQLKVEVDPGQTAEVTFLLGLTDDEEKARALVNRFRDSSQTEAAFQASRRWWDRLLGTIEVETPELSTNFLINRWLLYQTLSCRLWGRTAFYQSSGAYGFRDQLQDVMALVHAAPAMTREHILRAAARQFVEGDVQHWWHPDSSAGVRTRISDDLLWLPYVTAHYVRATGDAAILDQMVPFLEGKPLESGQAESLFVPAVSHTEGSLLEHCRRAIAHTATAGPHGLPLIGGGDWNDGLNRVGLDGKGESVWLAWFEICVLRDFAELLALRDLGDEAQACRDRAARLAKIVESHGWDGEWYRRGYFDDGTPLGSAENTEARIDSLTQTWAVFSDAADPDRSARALQSVEENLIRQGDNLIALLSPPFDKTSADVGYIKGYPPGVRENGSQYTHAAAWVAMAFARRGDGDEAVRLLRMLNPIEHARDEQDCERYKVEPYVVPGDVYSVGNLAGRGGWTWYTGAAGWIYRVWLEEVLGFQRRADKLIINPVIPKEWPGFRLRYRYGDTLYHIAVENPARVSRGVATVEVDGTAMRDKMVILRDDAVPHHVRVKLGSEQTREYVNLASVPELKRDGIRSGP